MEYPNSHEIEQEELSRHVARKNPAGTKEDSLGEIRNGRFNELGSWGKESYFSLSFSLLLIH